MMLGREKGGAVVEFALLLPIMLLILFGLIEFGLLFYNKGSSAESVEILRFR